MSIPGWTFLRDHPTVATVKARIHPSAKKMEADNKSTTRICGFGRVETVEKSFSSVKRKIFADSHMLCIFASYGT